jgi:hypothetical protein
LRDGIEKCQQQQQTETYNHDRDCVSSSTTSMDAFVAPSTSTHPAPAICYLPEAVCSMSHSRYSSLCWDASTLFTLSSTLSFTLPSPSKLPRFSSPLPSA